MPGWGWGWAAGAGFGTILLGAAGAAPRVAEAVVGGAVLAVAVPDGHDAVPVPGGLGIRPADHRERRAVHGFTLTIVTAGASRQLAATRGLGGRSARYDLERRDGGSGGAEFVLTAEVTCAVGVIRLRFETQAEHEPDLAPAWSLLASAHCRPADTAAPENGNHAPAAPG